MNTLQLKGLQKLIQDCNDPENARIYARDLTELGRRAWAGEMEKIARQYEDLMGYYQMCQRIVSSHARSSPLPDPEIPSLSHSFDVPMDSIWGMRRHYQITTQALHPPPRHVSLFIFHLASLNLGLLVTTDPCLPQGPYVR